MPNPRATGQPVAPLKEPEDFTPKGSRNLNRKPATPNATKSDAALASLGRGAAGQAQQISSVTNRSKVAIPS